MKLTPLLLVAAATRILGTPIDDRNVPSITDPNFIGRILDAHWYWRRIHCAQDLQWDHKLAEKALHAVSECTQKPKHEHAGSNLSSVGPTPKAYEKWLEMCRTIVHGWYEEEGKYPYHDPTYDDAWAHFTQLVWRDSSRVGCAVVHCPDHVDWPGRLYCLYENVGNVVNDGEYQKNVWGKVCGDPGHDRAGTPVNQLKH
ncbi:PR-1-like protein [Sporormia fimetaria CBS 119925]|uniref:PR-1-like protein n=1 Tax=Sporormia fimetaria CBS 119925 TaxID=1340428 RepID=A0A6A6V6H9_9PLEO|nr:PR-1-like protein [Sporormia fimetaria CBS 119925]